MTSSATDRHDGGLAISQWSAPALLLVALIAALTLVACRGDGRPGDYVGGEFVTVSAGGGHTCGVRVDGSVACWGAIALAGPRRGRGSSPPSAPGTGTPAVCEWTAPSTAGEAISVARPWRLRGSSPQLARGSTTLAVCEWTAPSTAGGIIAMPRPRRLRGSLPQSALGITTPAV